MLGYHGGVPVKPLSSLGTSDALTSGALEARASFFRIELASGAGHQIFANRRI
jgi:hypothetical protein